MNRNHRRGEDDGAVPTLDADLVKLASAIERTQAHAIWVKRLTNLRVTSIERRVRTGRLCRQTYWYAELDSTDGWKATIHSTKVIHAIDVDTFAQELSDTGVDLDDFEPKLFQRAMRYALGQPFRTAQDRLDTAACDSTCREDADQ